MNIHAEQFKIWLSQNRPDVQLIGEYQRASVPTVFKMPCGHFPLLAPVMIKKGGTCAVCRNRQVVPGTSLAATHPELAQEFDIEKNDGITSEQVCRGSNTKFWWKCACCKLAFYATPNSRTNPSIMSGCKFCARRAPTLEINLAALHPELAKEWHPTLNNGLLPSDFLPTSNKKVWWLYKCKHEAQQRIAGRVVNGKGCHKCGGSYPKTPAEHACDVASKHDERIVVLGDYITNKSPIEYQCTICNHIWVSLPRAILTGNGCPKCKLSRGALATSKFLTDKNIYFIAEYRFMDCKFQLPLPFDFFLPDLNICIEFDGRQHFISMPIWGGTPGFQKRQMLDAIKNEYCAKNQISLIRIPHTVYDDKFLEEFLEQELALAIVRMDSFNDT